MPYKFKKKIELVENLVRKKGWKIEKQALLKAFQRPRLRFVYLEIEVEEGKRAFLKFAPTRKLFENLVREREFLLFLEREVPGLSPQVLDHGLSWTLVEFLEEGIICQEEETSVLKPNGVKPLVKALKQLQGFSGKVPKTILKLSDHPLNYISLKRTKGTVLEINDFLRQYSSAQDYPFLEVEKFLFDLPERRGKGGIIVHGDLAPNNVFFTKDGSRVVLLDWEWAGYNPNFTLGRAFDFANFYLRCWRNPSFQRSLKAAYLREKGADNQELALGIILQGARQISGLCYLQHEKGPYLKKHIHSLICLVKESLEAV